MNKLISFFIGAVLIGSMQASAEGEGSGQDSGATGEGYNQNNCISSGDHNNGAAGSCPAPYTGLASQYTHFVCPIMDDGRLFVVDSSLTLSIYKKKTNGQLGAIEVRRLSETGLSEKGYPIYSSDNGAYIIEIKPTLFSAKLWIFDATTGTTLVKCKAEYSHPPIDNNGA